MLQSGRFCSIFLFNEEFQTKFITKQNGGLHIDNQWKLPGKREREKKDRIIN